MNGNVVVSVFCHLSLTYILLIQFTTDDVKTSLRGVLKGSSTIHENVHVTPESSEQQQAVELVVEELVSDTLSRFLWLR